MLKVRFEIFILIVPEPLIVTEDIDHLALVLLVIFIVVPRSGEKTKADVPVVALGLFQATDVPLKVIVLPFQVHMVVPDNVNVPVWIQLLPQVRVAEPLLLVIDIGTEQVHPSEDRESDVPGVRARVEDPVILIADEPSAMLPETVKVVLKVRVPT